METETHKPPMSVVKPQQECAEEEITDDTFVSGIKCNRCGNTVPPHMVKEHMNIHHPIHQCPHSVENKYFEINGRLENLLDLRAIKEGLEEIGDLDELLEKLPCQGCLERTLDMLSVLGDLDELNELLPRPEHLELIAEKLDELGDLEGLSKVLPSSEDIERVSDELSTLGNLDDLESKIDRISEKLKGVLGMKEQVEEAV